MQNREYDHIIDQLVFSGGENKSTRTDINKTNGNLTAQHTESKIEGSVEDCKVACNQQDKCEGFSREKNTNNCWLKSIDGVNNLSFQNNTRYDTYKVVYRLPSATPDSTTMERAYVDEEVEFVDEDEASGDDYQDDPNSYKAILILFFIFIGLLIFGGALYSFLKSKKRN